MNPSKTNHEVVDMTASVEKEIAEQAAAQVSVNDESIASLPVHSVVSEYRGSWQRSMRHARICRGDISPGEGL
jgi:hypothetical protein